MEHSEAELPMSSKYSPRRFARQSGYSGKEPLWLNGLRDLSKGKPGV
ncbi:hypothetical protein [Paraburkholderia fungorum]|nr:hypothetical protein [Paraburkholderia fungorum]